MGQRWAMDLDDLRVEYGSWAARNQEEALAWINEVRGRMEGLRSWRRTATRSLCDL